MLHLNRKTKKKKSMKTTSEGYGGNDKIRQTDSWRISHRIWKNLKNRMRVNTDMLVNVRLMPPRKAMLKIIERHSCLKESRRVSDSISERSEKINDLIYSPIFTSKPTIAFTETYCKAPQKERQ